MIGTIAGIGAGIIVGGMILNNIRIVRQSDAFVIERLGAYKHTWSVGLHFKIPIVETVAKKYP
jgi:regulator of protease activity HflC (stomatin/prohibitin superfamily)